MVQLCWCEDTFVWKSLPLNMFRQSFLNQNYCVKSVIIHCKFVQMLFIVKLSRRNAAIGIRGKGMCLFEKLLFVFYPFSRPALKLLEMKEIVITSWISILCNFFLHIFAFWITFSWTFLYIYSENSYKCHSIGLVTLNKTHAIHTCNSHVMYMFPDIQCNLTCILFLLTYFFVILPFCVCNFDIKLLFTLGCAKHSWCKLLFIYFLL